MIQGSLYSEGDNSCIVPKVSLTETMLERMKGLLWTDTLSENTALIIKPCSSVHTLSMNYPIDLAYLDKYWVIIKTIENIKPWRFSASPRASMVVELAAGSISRLSLQPGQKLIWQNAKND